MRLGLLQEETWSLLPTSSLVTVWGHGRELSFCRLSKKHKLTSHQDNLFLTLTSQDVELGKGNACVLTHPTPSPSMVIFYDRNAKELVLCSFSSSDQRCLLGTCRPLSGLSVRLFLWKVTSTRRLHCCCNFLWKHVRKSLWLWIYPASHQRVVHWSLHPIKVSWLQPVSQWYLLQGDLVFLSLLCFPCPVSVRENKLSNHFLAVWAVREVGQGTSLFAVLWGVVLGGWGPAAAAGREEGIWFPCGHSGLISGVSFWEDGSP